MNLRSHASLRAHSFRGGPQPVKNLHGGASQTFVLIPRMPRIVRAALGNRSKIPRYGLRPEPVRITFLSVMKQNQDR